MIDSLYNFTRKSWLKALSFILATAMFIVILLNSAIFAFHFGGRVPVFAMLVFYGMVTLWIHGIGFEIQSRFFKVVFMPLVAYFIVFPSLIYILSMSLMLFSKS